MSLLHIVLAGLLAAQNPALVAAPDTAETEAGPGPEVIAYYHSLRTSLRASASPRDRALSTMVVDLEPDAESRLLEGGRVLRAAAQAAPTDALVQAMWADTSDEGGGCDASSPCPERRLAHARLEPGNGLAWLPAFAGLDPEGDEAETEELLGRVASADRYEDHYVDGIRAWTQILSSRPLPRESAQSDTHEATIAMAMSQATFTMPHWLSISRACQRSRHPQAPARRFELCAQVGRKLMRGGVTIVTESMGFALVRSSGLATDEDKAAVRRLRWRVHSAAGVVDSLDSTREFAQFFEDLITTGNESRAMELSMQRHGVALEPPAGWHAPGDEDAT